MNKPIKNSYVKMLEKRVAFLDKICTRFSFKIVRQNEMIVKLKRKLEEVKKND